MFSDPIDPVLDQCPDYFSVVKHPMDLSTIQRKLDGDEYHTMQQWRQDVELVWANALTYNGPDSHLGILALEMQSTFQQHIHLFAESPAEEWYTNLSLFCQEFSSEVKAMSQVTPHLKRRSPSFTSIAPSQSEPEDAQWSWDDIAHLGTEIRKIRQKAHRLRLVQCLKCLSPSSSGAGGSWRSTSANLSASRLLALREEVELINQEKGKEKLHEPEKPDSSWRVPGGQ
jgi:hypothetical protein